MRNERRRAILSKTVKRDAGGLSYTVSVPSSKLSCREKISRYSSSSDISDAVSRPDEMLSMHLKPERARFEQQCGGFSAIGDADQLSLGQVEQLTRSPCSGEISDNWRTAATFLTLQ